MKPFGLMLIIIGIVFCVGGNWPLVGKLPGDIWYETRAGHAIFFPITTCILLSLLISFILKRV